MEPARRGGRGAPRGPVLHIVVVGFHHKKGCQVEFSYPPLIPGDGHASHAVPEEWRYLPFLALPDGAHNYQEDTVFFHLPPRNGNGDTVYGISCYRQIEAKALKVREADITRETVQKSVCVLSKLPLYGLLQAKLQLITHAYFEEKDFSQISILKELYEHMNSSLGGTPLEGSQVYLGLSPRDLVLHFRHKVLILFKLILLEKKVLFYISPVNKLVGVLVTVLSLFPGMIEHGLRDCSQYRPRKSTSEDAGLPDSDLPADDPLPGSGSAADFSKASLGTAKRIVAGNHGGGAAIETEEPLLHGAEHRERQEPDNTSQHLKPPPRPSPESSESDWETLDPGTLEEPSSEERGQVGSDQTDLLPKYSVLSDSPPITVQPQANTGQVVLTPGLVSGLEEDQYGMPLAIFTKVEEALIQIQDPELRKLLHPTTADLRFADFLVRHVTDHRDDVFLDGTGWEGGDEWIRAQFAVYTHALLAATLRLDSEKILSDYGTTFVTAWKNTHNYRVWNSNKHPALAEINPNHPFQGQYSMSDMKLRFSHSVQNSERGKKIGNAMVTTSRNVVQTGKAVGQSVGGAFSSAKTAMSSWLSTFTASAPQSLPEPPDGKP
ncbi:late secretory pathway protein AVL9 homolog isoform X2 [Heterocephalus glaber]|uniref:Late secretory pathway protein AVL9 homolog isoform X2 n=1 Tax=Heterocephalus glaber TaxID=10181 RepID=A0AAX6QPQ4_HETGA|nr:late secretory pathway protein AVL9 homolog isoform X2 [Heterocephalus glaber]